jgi:hypothetical protein
MLYREAFELNHMGIASAVAVILVALVLSIARAQTLVLDRSPERREGVSTVVASAPSRAGSRGSAAGRARAEPASGWCCSARWPCPSHPASTC